MAENWDLVSAFGFDAFVKAMDSAKTEAVRDNLKQVLEDAQAEHAAAAMAFDERPGFQWVYTFRDPVDRTQRSQVCTVRCRRCRWVVSYDLRALKISADEARRCAAAAVYEHDRLQHADPDARMRMRSWLGLPWAEDESLSDGDSSTSSSVEKKSVDR